MRRIRFSRALAFHFEALRGLWAAARDGRATLTRTRGRYR
jgi:hypothetical protein